MKIKIKENSKTKFIEMKKLNKDKKSSRQIKELIEIEYNENEMLLK